MNLVRVAKNGQITIPAYIRRILEIKGGDEMFFSRTEDGDIIISKTNLEAAEEAAGTGGNSED